MTSLSGDWVDRAGCLFVLIPRRLPTRMVLPCALQGVGPSLGPGPRRLAHPCPCTCPCPAILHPEYPLPPLCPSTAHPSFRESLPPAARKALLDHPACAHVLLSTEHGSQTCYLFQGRVSQLDLLSLKGRCLRREPSTPSRALQPTKHYVCHHPKRHGAHGRFSLLLVSHRTFLGHVSLRGPSQAPWKVLLTRPPQYPAILVSLCSPVLTSSLPTKKRKQASIPPPDASCFLRSGCRLRFPQLQLIRPSSCSNSVRSGAAT